MIHKTVNVKGTVGIGNITAPIISNGTNTSNIIVKNPCFIYDGYKSSKDYLDLGYNGIPQNVILNLIVFGLLIIVFSLIRKRAWNYGRITFFYQLDAQALEESERDPDILHGGVIRESSRNVRYRNQPNRRPNSNNPKNMERKILIDDHGLFRWILTTFTLSDEQIRTKSGEDAIHYLSFQRHLIFIAAFMTVISVMVVIPLHFEGVGGKQSNITDFASSTITNLRTSDETQISRRLLLLHIFIAMTYMIAAIAALRHYAFGLALAKQDPVISRTVMISRISKRHTHPHKIRNHFQEIYDGAEIEEISFAYDVSKLKSVTEYKSAATSARVHWENYLNVKGRRHKMSPYICGKLCSICAFLGICCKRLDAIEYYTEQEEEYRQLVETERKRALEVPLGIAFVTFASVEMAHQIVMDYRLRNRFVRKSPNTTFSRKLKANQWNVQHAPPPEDLLWENLCLTYKAWYVKAILVNLVVLLLVVVYSTPVIILKAINLNDGVQDAIQKFLGVVTAGLFSSAAAAPMLLLVITAVLPGLLSFSDEIVGFWTKTSENRSRMVKTYTFLLIMTVILPSLGATSLLLIFKNFSSDSAELLGIKCILDDKNGIFFVNYIITSAFIGMGSELLRLGELLCYAIKLGFAKSSAEMDSIRKSVVYEFQVGTQYAWTMLNFTMFIIFSLIYPVIMPFGLVYLGTKHYIDRYNVYFAYAPAKVDKQVHVTAMNFVFVSMFLLQTLMVVYVNVTLTTADQTTQLLESFTVVVFCLTLAFFISQVFCNLCTNFVPPASLFDRQVDMDNDGGPDKGDKDGQNPADTASRSSTSIEDRQEFMQPWRGSTRGMETSGFGVYRPGVLENDLMARYFPKILCPEGSDPTELIFSTIRNSQTDVGTDTSDENELTIPRGFGSSTYVSTEISLHNLP